MEFAMQDKAEGLTREEAFLRTYFQCLSKFAHEKAKNLTVIFSAEAEKENEKEETKSNATLLWSTTLHLLTTLSNSEKGFYSLLFLGLNLGSRLLGRKDALRQTYSCLLQELRRIETSHMGAHSTGSHVEQMLSSLCGQLQHFICARMNTISFYEQMLAMSGNRNVSSEDLFKVISTTLEEFQACVDHPILAPLKSSFVLESEIVIHLLKSQIHLQQCQFLQSLLNLHSANTKLATWGSILTSKEVKKLGFVSSGPKCWIPELYEWLIKYKCLLVSKFCLYFYDVLLQQGPPTEVRSLMAKASTDFFGRITVFHKKSDAHAVLLVLDKSGLDQPFTGLGYRLPESVASSGISSDQKYVVIFSYPTERPEKHLSNVFNHLNVKSNELGYLDRILCVSDEKPPSTYMMIRIDPLITMVAIYNSKKPKPDSHISNFMQTIGSELRCTRVFAGLKPGSK